MEEIVTRKGRLYSQIKIDEGTSIGSAKIRIRSLLAALKEKKRAGADATHQHNDDNHTYINPPFTDAMKDDYTILIPQLSPLHFQFIGTIFSASGYRVEELPKMNKEAMEIGLRYVNNDACFPAIMVVGQIIQAVRSGKYDPHKVALMIQQTGGACRSTNYIAFLKRAFRDSGLS